MGAHSKDRKSCHQSEDSALGPEEGSVPANAKPPTRTELRIRVNQKAGTTLQKKRIQKSGALHRKKTGTAGKQNKKGAREVLSSDRSLGGASDGGMRARHVSNGELGKIQSVADSTVVDNIAEEPPTCPECGRIFPSFKALYGHMRVHPPFKAKSKLVTAAGSSSDKVLIAGRDDQRILDSEDPAANAARNLMAMSRSNSLQHMPKLRQETTDRLQYRKRQCKLDALMGEEDMEAKQLQLKDAMHSENADVKASSSSLVFDEEVKKKKMKMKKKKKKKIKDLDSVHEAKPPTHNKDKNNSEDVAEMGDGNLDIAEELVESKNFVPGAATTQHRCTVCQATFPTGQALGGHKRKHWNGPATTPPSRPAPSPAPLSESEHKGNNMSLDIDLNELPKLEAEGP